MLEQPSSALLFKEAALRSLSREEMGKCAVPKFVTKRVKELTYVQEKKRKYRRLVAAAAGTAGVSGVLLGRLSAQKGPLKLEREKRAYLEYAHEGLSLSRGYLQELDAAGLTKTASAEVVPLLGYIHVLEELEKAAQAGDMEHAQELMDRADDLEKDAVIAGALMGGSKLLGGVGKALGWRGAQRGAARLAGKANVRYGARATQAEGKAIQADLAAQGIGGKVGLRSAEKATAAQAKATQLAAKQQGAQAQMMGQAGAAAGPRTGVGGWVQRMRAPKPVGTPPPPAPKPVGTPPTTAPPTTAPPAEAGGFWSRMFGRGGAKGTAPVAQATEVAEKTRRAFPWRGALVGGGLLGAAGLGAAGGAAMASPKANPYTGMKYAMSQIRKKAARVGPGGTPGAPAMGMGGLPGGAMSQGMSAVTPSVRPPNPGGGGMSMGMGAGGGAGKMATAAAYEGLVRSQEYEKIAGVLQAGEAAASQILRKL